MWVSPWTPSRCCCRGAGRRPGRGRGGASDRRAEPGRRKRSPTADRLRDRRSPVRRLSPRVFIWPDLAPLPGAGRRHHRDQRAHHPRRSRPRTCPRPSSTGTGPVNRARGGGHEHLPAARPRRDDPVLPRRPQHHRGEARAIAAWPTGTTKFDHPGHHPTMPGARWRMSRCFPGQIWREHHGPALLELVPADPLPVGWFPQRGCCRPGAVPGADSGLRTFLCVKYCERPTFSLVLTTLFF